jgi:hypothetical protein
MNSSSLPPEWTKYSPILCCKCVRGCRLIVYHMQLWQLRYIIATKIQYGCCEAKSWEGKAKICMTTPFMRVRKACSIGLNHLLLHRRQISLPHTIRPYLCAPSTRYKYITHEPSSVSMHTEPTKP